MNASCVLIEIEVKVEHLAQMADVHLRGRKQLL